MNRLAFLLACTLLTACASNAPPNLSPAGQTAFVNTRVIRGLDVLRDIAVDANARTPPLVSTATTQKIVSYHKAALNTIHTLGTGWQATVSTGLEEIVKVLSPAEQHQLQPYVVLARTVIAEVK